MSKLILESNVDNTDDALKMNVDENFRSKIARIDCNNR